MGQPAASPGKTTGGTVKISQCYNAAAVSIADGLCGRPGGYGDELCGHPDQQLLQCGRSPQAENAAGAIGWLRLDKNGEHKLTLEGVFNAGTIAGTSQGGLLGYQTTTGQVTNTLTNCSYWDDCGATGEGNALTSNQMTEDDAWSKNPGFGRWRLGKGQ